VSGDTFYLGSPKSDRQFRGYNKAAELGIINGSAWLRLELELRSIRAASALASCADNGVPETVSGHMADFLTYRNSEFEAAIGTFGVEPETLHRKKSNRQRWLLGQVAQALAKEIAVNGSFRSQFDRAVDDNLDPLLNRE
jgi:hypothetical protein